MKIEREFLNFRRINNDFENIELWEDEIVDNFLIFWNFAATYAPIFSILALHHFEYAAISIPCE
jgi:hypothetical protein